MRLGSIRFQRPVGIILLSAYQVAGAVFALVDFVTWLFGGPHDGIPFAARGLGELFFGLTLGVFSIAVTLFLAYALWQGRSWVWYVMLAFLVLGLFGSVVAGFTSDPMLLGWTVFTALFIVYLLLPNVRGHFGTANPT